MPLYRTPKVTASKVTALGSADRAREVCACDALRLAAGVQGPQPSAEAGSWLAGPGAAAARSFNGCGCAASRAAVPWLRK